MSERDENLDFELLDLLYDEVDDEEAARIQARLAHDPEAKARYESWRAVRQMSTQLESEAPDLKIHYELLRAAKRAHERPIPSGWMSWISRLSQMPVFAAFAVFIVSAGLLYTFTDDLKTEDSHAPMKTSAIVATPKAVARLSDERTGSTEIEDPMDAPDTPRPAMGSPAPEGDERTGLMDTSSMDLEPAATAKPRPGTEEIRADAPDVPRGNTGEKISRKPMAAPIPPLPLAQKNDKKTRQLRGEQVGRPKFEGRPSGRKKRSVKQRKTVDRSVQGQTLMKRSKARARTKSAVQFAPSPTAASPPVVQRPVAPHTRRAKTRTEDLLLDHVDTNGPRQVKQSVGDLGHPEKRTMLARPSSLERARVARRQNQHRRAIQLYRSHLAQLPKSAQPDELWFEMAQSYEALGRLGEARTLYQKVVARKGALMGRAQQRIQVLNSSRPQKEQLRKTPARRTD
ncbi:MAG: tetratricopeptide repeat protein [Myxococcota bacterium]|nr:tetratricopeptide repeat protein [Myxococcota bacterium]